MAALTKYPQPLVFGLDIGTRSIVGTVGYQEIDGFHVVAQCVKYHETRAMLDGQIHDIATVAEEIAYVKAKLEGQVGRELTEVCIAAAGRVLKTAVGKAEYDFQEPIAITMDHIHSLEMLGVEKAYEQIVEEIGTDEDGYVEKYFCVGYTVIHYYMNGYEIGNLEGHKAKEIAGDILATFLPEDVVDGLYTAVDQAGLTVANLTLEPIAAMNVAIPESYRMLNICLVDVGAGTSDICVTKDNSVIGYGMIPSAGDEITERIVKEYLVDFNTAETIKMISPKKKSLTYKDILGISHKVTPKEVYSLVKNVVDSITKSVADKIIELNGGKTVSAVFVVGGGGKLPGFTASLAKHLKLPEERVALRGEEVMQDVHLHGQDMKKDPLFVTPIGICLNYYDQKNNFIFVLVNQERIKLYNNDHLTVFDAARQLGLKNEMIFPKRGADLNYTVDGKDRFVRGHQGEAAVITVNGHETSINSPIAANDRIVIEESTKGEDASMTLSQIPEFTKTISFQVNDVKVSCPKYASVNGKLESEYYQIQDHDEIQMLNYYTVEQLLTFMDIAPGGIVFVNNEEASSDTKVYENFKVTWIEEPDSGISMHENDSDEDSVDDMDEDAAAETEDERSSKEQLADKESGDDTDPSDKKSTGKRSAKRTSSESDKKNNGRTKTSGKSADTESVSEKKGLDKGVSEEGGSGQKQSGTSIVVTVNNKQYTLKGKDSYVFVEVFDVIGFDTSTVRGKELVMTLNGNNAGHFDELQNGDQIEIYWRS